MASPPQNMLSTGGCVRAAHLNFLLLNLHVNMMFFYLDAKIEWGIEKSIHAFIDDILFRARSLKDVRLVFEAFDDPARALGLDMNVDKTELNALQGSGHTEIVTKHGGTISTLDSRGQPRSCYKYLGVFFYNSDAQNKVLDYVHAEIIAFFARLAPLSLTATELISLVNKQPIPVLAYQPHRATTPRARTAPADGMAATERSTRIPHLPPGATPPVPATTPVPGTVSVPPRPPRARRTGPPGPTPPRTATRPIPPAATATTPLRGGSMDDGGPPPPPVPGGTARGPPGAADASGLARLER